MSATRIVACGAKTPLGQGALPSALGVRAAKLELRPSALRDRRGNTIATARCSSIGDDVRGQERRLELAAPALAEVRAALPGGPAPLLLALPSVRDERESRAFVQSVAARAGVSVDLATSSVFGAGSMGFVAALARAEELVEKSRGVVVVGAVDTTFDEEQLAALDRGHRLYSADAVDPVLPSEGAAFFVVAPAASGAPAWARLRALATAVEPGFDDDSPILAVASTDALRRVTEGAPRPAEWVVSDTNGEWHVEREWSYATGRIPDVFVPGRTKDEHPVVELGDAGAARGALVVSYVVTAMRFGFAPARDAIVGLGGDGPERGALWLEAP